MSAKKNAGRSCPTPSKRAYSSKKAATHGLRTMNRTRADGGHGRIHVYLCDTRTHWHIGHGDY